jgi:hypothetical protein
MYLYNWVINSGSSNWQTYSWPVNVSGNIGAMVSLSQMNNHNDASTAAVGYIVGYRTQANPNIAYTSGDPSVIFVNGCTQLIFGMRVYGNISARISGAIWP